MLKASSRTRTLTMFCVRRALNVTDAVAGGDVQPGPPSAPGAGDTLAVRETAPRTTANGSTKLSEWVRSSRLMDPTGRAATVVADTGFTNAKPPGETTLSVPVSGVTVFGPAP